MDGQNRFDGFQFNQNLVLDQQVDSAAPVQLLTLVTDWNGLICYKIDSASAQLVGEALLIQILEKPWS